MKYSLVFLLSLCLLAVSCNLPASRPENLPSAINPTDPFETSWDDLSIFKSGLIFSAQPALQKLTGASIYRIQLRLSDELLHITGREEVRYTNREAVALREIHFRLFPNILGGNMRINNVHAGETEVFPRYDLNNSLMILPLPEALDPGDSILLGMDFTVTVPNTVDLNLGILAFADNVLALAHSYPMIEVYDDEGWNEKIPTQNGDLTYTDASFYLVRITARDDLTLVTSGSEIGHASAGGYQVLTIASGPARDFYLAASPDYVETKLVNGDLTIRSYVRNGFESGVRSAVEIASQAVDVYSSRYAPYPYTELDIVATPTHALGIEYPGIVAITSWTFDPGAANAPYYLEAAVAHEVGHQWFYNLVGNDQLDDPWLDESLTQFATLQYYSDRYGLSGYQGFRSSLESRWSSVDFSPIPIGLPVAQYQASEYYPIVYGRGPLFFEAMKEKMGSSKFDAFMREYSTSLAWDISTPETLRSLAEKNCGCGLGELFNEWVYPIQDQ